MSILAAVLVISLSACTANKKPDVVIPIEAENKTNPLLADRETLKEGRELYLQSCAICHGTDGHGRTDLGRGMYPPAMDLTSPHVQHWNDAELYWIIQNGVRLTGMPSWKSSLSDADGWKLVHFIHGLPRAEAQAAAMATCPSVGAHTAMSNKGIVQYGRTLYRQESCFMCHQLNGDGGKIGPDLTVEGTRGRSDEWLISHFKNPTAYIPGSVMPPFRNLTDEQLKALTAFLQSQKSQRNREER
jgi:mono/diheme cytochrome c family protein